MKKEEALETTKKQVEYWQEATSIWMERENYEKAKNCLRNAINCIEIIQEILN